MYRPQIKVFDCTVRDGGLINNHDFDERFVRAVYMALAESGSCDYRRLGTRNSQGLFSAK
jgi:4-hydroxy 2-oxovalerate aldolase